MPAPSNVHVQDYRTIRVRIRSEMAELLASRAEHERRRPQDEAAILLERALGITADAAAARMDESKA